MARPDLTPRAYSPEVAARLREVVNNLDGKLLDMQHAADGLYGFALAFDGDAIPPDLAGAGFVYFGVNLTDWMEEMRESYRELHSLAVVGKLYEGKPGDGDDA